MFTGQLGTSDSKLANIQLASYASGSSNFFDSASALDSVVSPIQFFSDLAIARDFTVPPTLLDNYFDSGAALDMLSPPVASDSYTDSATSASSFSSPLAAYLAEAADARDSVASAGIEVAFFDKATTRETAQSNAGNIANGRFVR